MVMPTTMIPLCSVGMNLDLNDAQDHSLEVSY